MKYNNNLLMHKIENELFFYENDTFITCYYNKQIEIYYKEKLLYF